MPCKNIIFTGMPTLDIGNFEAGFDKRLAAPDFVRKVAEGFEKLAQAARQLGVTLHYHNHNWEFANGALIHNALGEYAPSLHFALDIGWVSVAGYPPEALLAKYPGRINYVHLRDYKKADAAAAQTFAEKQQAYCALGEGDAFHWPTLLPALQKALGPQGWAVVEYETGERDAARYEKAVAFVNKVLAAPGKG